MSQIQIGFSCKQETLGCFVDVNNAYNNVDIVQVTRKLDELEVGSSICRYIWMYLKERHITIYESGTNKSITRWTCKGLAQGDPMSPILFNIATRDICRNIEDVYISQYADDFVLYVSGQNLSFMSTLLQNALNSLSIMLRDLGLELSSNKSKLCLFSRRRLRQQVNVSIEYVNLESVEEVKYLGIWLDKSLRWGKQIKETCSKLNKFLNVFNVLAGSSWGVHPLHLRQLYISIIRSRLDYGSFLLNTSSLSNLVKLDKIQNRAMRVIGGFIKSSPIHVMESELCLPPLSFRRKYLAYKFLLKSMSVENGDSIAIISKLATVCENSRYWINKRRPLLSVVYNELSDVTVQKSPILEMYSLPTWVSNIDIRSHLCLCIDDVHRSKRFHSSDNLLKNSLNTIQRKYSDCFQIYTDGSKDDNGIGASFYDSQANITAKFKINSDISILEAELIAIYECLSYIRSCDGNKFVVLSDSKSALQHIARCTSVKRGLPVAYGILETFLNLKDYGKEVKFQWIPSHINLIGNEAADRGAKMGIVDGIPVSHVPFFTDFLRVIKVKCLDNWKEHFNKRSVEKGIWYKTLQSEPPKIPWFYNVKLSRRMLVTSLRLRSGHAPLNAFGFMMNVVQSPNCTVCNTREDVYHALVECARVGAERRDLEKEIGFNFGCVGICNSILADPTSELAIKLYLMFLKLIRIRVQ